MNFKLQLAVILTALFISNVANAGLVIMDIKSIIMVTDNRMAKICVNRITDPVTNGECSVQASDPYCSAAGATERITLNLDDVAGKEIFSMLLTAHTASRNVQFFLSNTAPCSIDTVNILEN